MVIEGGREMKRVERDGERGRGREWRVMVRDMEGEC